MFLRPSKYDYLMYYQMAHALNESIYVLTRTKYAPVSDAEKQIMDFAIKYIKKARRELIKTAENARDNRNPLITEQYDADDE